MPTPERETPDVDTASSDYARRFHGPVGEWFLDVQARATLELAEPWRGGSVLDVGGGHGQVAVPLAEAGHAVTVLSSERACADRLRPAVEAGRVQLDDGELARLPYADDAFDVAVSFRLLPHLVGWREVVAELCRVTREAVIVDYPTRRSVNAVADALFGVKKGIEGNTRPFTVFGDAEIEAAFADGGFRPTGRRPQFFFPMALHRALRSAALARGLEATAAAAGATRHFGSPVILRVQP